MLRIAEWEIGLLKIEVLFQTPTFIKCKAMVITSPPLCKTPSFTDPGVCWAF